MAHDRIMIPGHRLESTWKSRKLENSVTYQVRGFKSPFHRFKKKTWYYNIQDLAGGMRKQSTSSAKLTCLHSGGSDYLGKVPYAWFMHLASC